MSDVEAALRAGLAYMDVDDRAATGLLLDHDYWLRRADFQRDCVDCYGDGVARIRWQDAALFLTYGPVASSSQLAILDLAVGLGQNRYRLPGMGHAHARMILDAVRVALGVPSDR